MIVHKGIVREVRGGMVVVGVEAAGACAGCKVAGLCGLSGESEKEVGVWDAKAAEYAVGDEVVVGIGTAMAVKAVLWAYVVPFSLMLATLFTVGGSDLRKGLATLGAVILYYIVLWFFRGGLQREIVFKLAK